RLGEAVQPDEQQVGQLPRQLLAVGVLVAGGDQLLGEEGVAVGAADDAAQVGFGHRGGSQRTDQCPQVVGPEPFQMQPVDGGEAGPLRQGGAQRVAAVQVVAAEADDDGDLLGVQASEQEPEQVAGGPVGPVDVF